MSWDPLLKLNLLKYFEKFNYYPPEYNASIHGPYHPSRYYGKLDTPFSNVKLKDLPSWFSRRDKSLMSTWNLIDRSIWRWRLKYMMPRQPTAIGIFQLMAAIIVGEYMFRDHWEKRHYKAAKYH
ncbi:hypothetical protein GJ496_007867 [Pomphorhynchus laevis]|nr:hypothetical protein GJ496_007867 [Pomphorhynchus laevis]